MKQWSMMPISRTAGVAFSAVRGLGAAHGAEHLGKPLQKRPSQSYRPQLAARRVLGISWPPAPAAPRRQRRTAPWPRPTAEAAGGAEALPLAEPRHVRKGSQHALAAVVPHGVILFRRFAMIPFPAGPMWNVRPLRRLYLDSVYN